LWHGMDPTHPLHEDPSAPAASEALVEVHRALDRMIGDLVSAANGAAIVAFAMGGMGANHSDVPSMVLLPELLYREAFGRPLLTLPPEWSAAPDGMPVLKGDQRWSLASRAWVPEPAQKPKPHAMAR